MFFVAGCFLATMWCDMDTTASMRGSWAIISFSRALLRHKKSIKWSRQPKILSQLIFIYLIQIITIIIQLNKAKSNLMFLLKILNGRQVVSEIRHRSDRPLLTNPWQLILHISIERVKQKRIFEIIAADLARLDEIRVSVKQLYEPVSWERGLNGLYARCLNPGTRWCYIWSGLVQINLSKSRTMRLITFK